MMILRRITFSFVLCGALSAHAQMLTLSNAYEEALKNEPKLRASAYRTAATEEGVRQSKAQLHPQIQGSVSYGGYQYNAPYLSTPIKENYSSYSIGATQGLYHPELWRTVDESKARQKGANYQFQADAQKLGLDLAKAYFNVIRTQKNVDLFASQKEYYETKYHQLEEMLKLGLTNRVDLLEAKVHRDKSMAEWLGEQKRALVARLKLEHLIGEKVDELPNFDFGAINLKKISMERAEWEAKLFNNPSLKTSQASQEVAIHEVAVRNYQHYPKVDLSLTRKETYTQDLYSHKYDNQAIVQMTIPLYEGGYTQSRVREGKLLLDAANQELEYTRQETQLTFEELWAEREYSVETLIALKESEKSAELYVQSVEKAYNAGLKSLIEVLEAKAKLYEVKRDIIDAGYTLVNNELSLLDAVGELNVDRIRSYETLFLMQGEDR